MSFRLHGHIAAGSAALVAAAGTAFGQVQLYATDFEPPTFAPGALVGQGGFHAFEDLSVSAATVSAVFPRGGLQSVRVDGGQLEPFLTFAYAGGYLHDVSYDPIGGGTPQVELLGFVSTAGPRLSCGAGLSLDDATASSFGFIGLDLNTGTVFIANMDGGRADGPVFVPDQYASLRAVYDFETRTMSGYFNDLFIGAIPFSTGLGGQVGAVEMFLSAPFPTAPVGVVAYYDDLSLTAVPGPGVAVVLAVGALGAVGRRRGQGR